MLSRSSPRLAAFEFPTSGRSCLGEAFERRADEAGQRLEVVTALEHRGGAWGSEAHRCASSRKPDSVTRIPASGSASCASKPAETRGAPARMPRRADRPRDRTRACTSRRHSPRTSERSASCRVALADRLSQDRTATDAAMRRTRCRRPRRCPAFRCRDARRSRRSRRAPHPPLVLRARRSRRC
jgi:hypothetical protein